MRRPRGSRPPGARSSRFAALLAAADSGSTREPSRSSSMRSRHASATSTLGPDQAETSPRVGALIERYGDGLDGSSPAAAQWARLLEGPADAPITLINRFKLRTTARYADPFATARQRSSADVSSRCGGSAPCDTLRAEVIAPWRRHWKRGSVFILSGRNSAAQRGAAVGGQQHASIRFW